MSLSLPFYEEKRSPRLWKAAAHAHYAGIAWLPAEQRSPCYHALVNSDKIQLQLIFYWLGLKKLYYMWESEMYVMCGDTFGLSMLYLLSCLVECVYSACIPISVVIGEIHALWCSVRITYE